GVVPAAAGVADDQAVVRAAREDPVLGVVQVAAAADFQAVYAKQEDAGVVGVADGQAPDLEVAHFKRRARRAFFEFGLRADGDAIPVAGGIDDRRLAAG